MKYAQVVVSDRVSMVQDAFDYRVPEDMRSTISVGSFVLVPFGQISKRGIVVGLSDAEPKIHVRGKRVTLRTIQKLYSGYVLDPRWVEIAKYIADYYVSPLYRVMHCLIPAEIFSQTFAYKTEVYLYCSSVDRSVSDQLRRSKKQLELLDWFRSRVGEWVKMSECLEETGFSRQLIRSAVRKGWLSEKDVKIAQEEDLGGRRTFHSLNADQQRALDTILTSDTPVLLKGVTGSGKTEVYLQAAHRVIKEGWSAIILVPEIALTPQMETYFSDVFGSRVAVWHSKLTPYEKAVIWDKAYHGQLDVVIGSRSALFMPFKNLGLVVVDEEHDASYKQDQTPRYHVRNVVHQMHKLFKARVVFGTATPSLEMMHQVSLGTCKEVELSKRINALPSPAIEIVDMSKEMRSGNFSLLSERLRQALEDVIVRNEQAMLFVNRRGTSSSLLCRDCGFVAECNDCAVSLKHHRVYDGSRYVDLLLCHYCGSKHAFFLACPMCQGSRIKTVGVGTQRVVEYLKGLWPDLEILRADSDTLQRKGSHKKIFDAFKHRQAQVLVGTQVIAKGHDIPGVSLVGVVLADIGLHRPDFRSFEQGYALLKQVAGRCGRGDLPGRVIIQSYHPDHPVLESLVHNKEASFYAQEFQRREQFGYPPFVPLTKLSLHHEQADRVRQEAKDFADSLKSRFGEDRVYGPVAGLVPKIQGRHIYHIILKGIQGDDIRPHVSGDWRIDVDPKDLL